MYDELRNFLKTITDENRLKIIDMLSCKKLSNKDMLDFLDISQPTLSHHLKVLEQGNLIYKEIEKNTHYYFLKYDVFQEKMQKIHKLYCQKDTCLCFIKKGENNE